MSTASKIFWASRTMGDTKLKLKVGNEVFHKEVPKLFGIITSIHLDIERLHGGWVIIKIISNLNNDLESTQGWYYNNCILVKEKERQDSNLCNCTIEILMGKGCACGGS